MTVTITVDLIYTVPVDAFTRMLGFSVGGDGASVRSMLRRLRGRDKCAFFCGSGRIGLSGGVSVGVRSSSVRIILGRVFRGSKCSCQVMRGRVIVCAAPAAAIRRAIRRGGRRGIANMMGSVTKSPVVKTSVVRGKSSSGKAVAGIGNSFSLVMANGRLRIDCVKCVPRAVGLGPKMDSCGMVVGRSAGALSRMIMIKCDARGGRDLANTLRAIGDSGLGSVAAPSMRGVLGKGIPKMCMTPKSKRPKSKKTIIVHKRTALDKAATPL